VAGDEAAFKTRDFYLRLLSALQGYDLIDLRAEGRRKVFIFCDRPTRRDDVLLPPGRGDSAAGVFRNQSKI